MNRPSLTALALAAALVPGAALAGDALPGDVILESRLRLETIDQEGKPLDAEAVTLRTRLGWQSPELADFRLLLEMEAVAAPVDDYSDPVRPNPLRPTVADPEIVELNRAQVTWDGLPGAQITAGRQRLVFGNARYLGNSGWRQNEQTFDGVRRETKAFEPVSFTYAWAGRVNRPLGREHPDGVWHGDIHALIAETGTPFGRLAGYGYLIDLDETPALSSQTFGLRLAGARQVRDGLSATWEAEFARQGDYADNPGDYTVDYQLLSAGLKAERWSVGTVFERLEGDGVHAFQTPLATSHGVQGWSDVIGATPAFGVNDLFLKGELLVSVGLAKPLKLKAEAHDFRDSDGERRIGRELDLSASIPVGKRWTLEAKAARFEGDLAGFSDTTKGWLIVEYRY